MAISACKCKRPRFPQNGAIYICPRCLTVWEWVDDLVGDRRYWKAHKGKKAIKFLTREVIPEIKKEG